MLPEQYQNIAAFCEDVTYNKTTGELKGKRQKFDANLDNVLINRRRVDKGRIIAMLVYGYPHLLQPAAHLGLAEDDDARWAAHNLRYTYEPQTLNPLGLAEGGAYFVRGGVLHRMMLPVGTQFNGHEVVSPSAVEISEGTIIIDGHGIIPTITVGEHMVEAALADEPTAKAEDTAEIEGDEYDDLV